MQMTATSIEVSRTIRADAESLFQAWVDPEKLLHWWRQEGEGWAFASAMIDLRVGGHFRLAMTDPRGNIHAAVGVYREIDPPVRLVFTWDWEEPITGVSETQVTVDFKQTGINVTEVVVTHERFTQFGPLGRHQQGWTELLRLLEDAFA